MPWTTTQNIIVEGLNFFRLVPINKTATNALATAGAKIDFLMVTKEGEEFANATSEPEYKEKNLTNNVKLKMQITTTTIDPTTGDVVASGNQTDKLTVGVLINKSDKDNLVNYIRTADQVWAGVIGIGRNPSGDILGFEHLIGTISGNLTEERAGGEMTEITLSLQGGKAYAEATGFRSSYASAVTSPTITPVGESAITIKALTNEDFETLLQGKIVRTSAS